MADRNRLAEFSDAEVEMIRDALQVIQPDSEEADLLRRQIEREFDIEAEVRTAPAP